LQRKLERSKKIEMAGAADEVLMAEIAEYKVLVHLDLIPNYLLTLIFKILASIFNAVYDLYVPTKRLRPIEFHFYVHLSVCAMDCYEKLITLYWFS